MHYTKPALSFDQQADLLLKRGLIVADKQTLVLTLSLVNYYRLSAYSFPFRMIDAATGDETFKPGTTLEVIWKRYCFDRQLRLIIMNAIEYVEVAILRTRMVEIFTGKYGPFGYADIHNFSPSFLPDDHRKMIDDLAIAVQRSNEEFVDHYRNKYDEETLLPLWMSVEVMTFGQLFTFYRNLNRSEKQAIASGLGVFPPVLDSWLKTLNYIRNSCAHHARLWNRELPIRPLIPDKKHQPDWYIPGPMLNHRIYAVLTYLKYLVDILYPQNNWKNELLQIFLAYPEIELKWMGFPKKWETCPIWMK